MATTSSSILFRAMEINDEAAGAIGFKLEGRFRKTVIKNHEILNELIIFAPCFINSLFYYNCILVK